MKKLLATLLATSMALTAMGGLVACGNDEPTPVPAPSITLNRTTMTLKPDMSKGIIAELAPANSNTKVTWTSSDPKIASVNEGYVQAWDSGTVTITAEADGHKATCTVTVGDWQQYYIVGDGGKGSVVLDGESYALAWDGDAAAENKEAGRKLQQDDNDKHKWTATLDLQEGAAFKITRFDGGWDPAIGSSDAEGAENTTITAEGTTLNFVDKNNAPNINVEDEGRYEIIVMMKVGGGVESVSYKRVGDIPA